MIRDWIKEYKEKISYIIITLVLISILWNILDVNRQEIITSFENQIIGAQDNEMTKLLAHTSIKHTEVTEEQDENVAYADKSHTIITTTDDMDLLTLKVRYNEANEIVLLNYSCELFWPKVGAIFLGAFLAFLILCILAINDWV